MCNGGGADTDHLNSRHITIQFTTELEKDGSLPFLRTVLTRKGEGSIDIIVHRKSTHTDCYLQYLSHHPENVKRGVASCLFHRARTVSVAARRKKPPEEKPEYTVCLPYVSGVGKDLKRILRRYDIRTVFTTTSTL